MSQLLTTIHPGDPAADIYAQRSRQVAEALVARCWDDSPSAFWDIDMCAGEQRKILTVSSIFPILLDAVPDQLAQRVIDEHLLNPERFWLTHPVPSIAADEPAFDPHFETGRSAAHGRGLMASALLFSSGRVSQANATGSVARHRVLAFLRARHADPGLTVDDVAHACLISRRTLYRLFDGSPGGVGNLLRGIRVEHAQALLRADLARPLDSIALACGFAGERQFYRVFRHETGCTPGEFRAAGTAGQ